MKVLCGTDIIEIDRIKKSIERSGEHFLHLIYTPAEIDYCESKRNAKYSHYAGRFAAKEALYKAVSTLLPDKFAITWKDVQIINGENGNPRVEFLNIKFDQITSIDISISHSKSNAIANVTLLVE